MAYFIRNNTVYKQEYHTNWRNPRWPHIINVPIGPAPKPRIIDKAINIMAKYERKNQTTHTCYLYASRVARQQLSGTTN